jgi:hypothetical protein
MDIDVNATVFGMEYKRSPVIPAKAGIPSTRVRGELGGGLVVR